jgi:pimeloyl-ACP methyl ester carboxylesterase
MTPETRYARTTDGTHVAFQIVGEGPIDIVVMRSWFSNLDNEWEDPVVAGIYRRLGSLGRVIVFDRRGTGLSDRLDPQVLPTLEDRIDDLRAVMAAPWPATADGRSTPPATASSRPSTDPRGPSGAPRRFGRPFTISVSS